MFGHFFAALLSALTAIMPMTASATTTAPRATTAAPAVTKVLTVVFENHGASSATKGMPYLASLGSTYGRTTSYRSLTHPSLPNYLAMAGGSTFNVHDDGSPASHPLTGSSVFDVALGRGQTAKTYAESMSSTCGRTAASPYAVKHNPWAYFSQHRASCARDDVPAGTVSAGALHQDITAGRLPRIGVLIPNLCNDAHDCSLRTADAWLHRWVSAVQAGPDWRSGRLAVVVTFDEVEGTGGGSLMTVVASPRLHHKVVGDRLDHYSWCRWMTDSVAAPPLRSAAHATSLGKAFGLA